MPRSSFEKSNPTNFKRSSNNYEIYNTLYAFEFAWLFLRTESFIFSLHLPKEKQRNARLKYVRLLKMLLGGSEKKFSSLTCRQEQELPSTAVCQSFFENSRTADLSNFRIFSIHSPRFFTMFYSRPFWGQSSEFLREEFFLGRSIFGKKL